MLHPSPAKLAVAIVLTLAPAASGCAHGATDQDAPSEPRSFDPTTPTGGIVAPGTEPEVEPGPNMEQVSFDDEAGPADHVRSAPKREPIPSFQLFGTKGEGPG